MQVEGGDPLIVVLHEPEGLEGEARLLGRAVQLHPGLIVTCTPGRVNKRSVSQNAEPGGDWGLSAGSEDTPTQQKGHSRCSSSDTDLSWRSICPATR